MMSSSEIKKAGGTEYHSKGMGMETNKRKWKKKSSLHIRVVLAKVVMEIGHEGVPRNLPGGRTSLISQEFQVVSSSTIYTGIWF